TFSETRVYMAILLGSVMSIIMLSFMWKMYQNKKVNVMILAGSVLTFGISLWLVRSQATVDDTSCMSAMIPNHSIAILMSERDDITDVRAQKLRDEIIEAQRREIEEMKQLIEDIEENGPQEEESN